MTPAPINASRFVYRALRRSHAINELSVIGVIDFPPLDTAWNVPRCVPDVRRQPCVDSTRHDVNNLLHVQRAGTHRREKLVAIAFAPAHAGRGEEGDPASCAHYSFRQPRPAHTRECAQALEPVPQDALTCRREPIGPASILGWQRLDPLARLEPRDGAIERARGRVSGPTPPRCPASSRSHALGRRREKSSRKAPAPRIVPGHPASHPDSSWLCGHYLRHT